MDIQKLGNSPGHEVRAFSIAEIETEERVDDGGLRLAGYAAVFDRVTDIGGMFDEVIRPGAFQRAIAAGQDVALLYNHDPSTVMARTSNGTLQLREDGHGLWFEAELSADDVDAQRVMAKVRARNVSQGSFAFDINGAAGELWDLERSKPLRQLLDLDLYDVSPVTYPAYEDTQVFARGRVVAPPTPAIQEDGPAQSQQQLGRLRRRISVHRVRIRE